VGHTFHLIDLVTQRAAVERLLAGLSDDDKMSWLSKRGRIIPIEMTDTQEKVFHFISPTGREAIFFLRDGQFVFVADHTTF